MWQHFAAVSIVERDMRVLIEGLANTALEHNRLPVLQFSVW